MFIENKYYRWYLRIIERAVTRPTPSEYTERHHVIPRSFGGSDAPENLVTLTFREHFLVHWLLTKCTEGEFLFKARWALHYMSLSLSGRKLSSWQYKKCRDASRL